MEREATYAVFSNPAPEEGGIQVLFAGRSQTKSGHKLGPKVFDHFLIHYVERGRGIYSAGGNIYELKAGDSFIIYPQALVSYAADQEDPWKYRWVAFKGEAAEELVQKSGISPHAPIVQTGTQAGVEHWFERIMQLFKEKPISVNLQAVGYLHMLMAAYQEAVHIDDAQETALSRGTADRSGELVKQAVNYMTAQYAEPITMELMAESLGYSRAYLSRVFRERTGVTPIAFLVRLRLDRARRLLRERMELTIEQVAYSVGFADPLYFSKQFRRVYGESPSEYRASVNRLLH